MYVYNIESDRWCSFRCSSRERSVKDLDVAMCGFGVFFASSWLCTQSDILLNCWTSGLVGRSLNKSKYSCKSTTSSCFFSWRMSFGDIDVDVQEPELIWYKVLVCVGHFGGWLGIRWTSWTTNSCTWNGGSFPPFHRDIYEMAHIEEIKQGKSIT